MAGIGKQATMAIANKIEKFNSWLYHSILHRQKQLEAMGVENLIEENRTYLQNRIALLKQK